MRRHSGAWIFVLACLLSLTVMLWRIKDWRQSSAVGDGQHLDSYGFDLSHCLVPSEHIVAAGMPKDGLPALVRPRLLDAAGLDSLNASGRSAFLLPRDRVIGVALDGVARAYPLSILNWHELVNDTLAGRPILVSWSPLSGSTAVYDRRLARGVAEFGVSGLLYHSNALFYDLGEPGEESLWSQLQGRALAGPAAGDSLKLVSARLTHWGAWSADHPGSSVLAPDPARMSRYRRKPYVNYEGNDQLQFPAQPLPAGEWPLKTAMVSVWAGGERRFYSLPELREAVGAQDTWQIQQGDARLRFRVLADPPAIEVFLGEENRAAPSVQAYWFAWYSQLRPLFPGTPPRE